MHGRAPTTVSCILLAFCSWAAYATTNEHRSGGGATQARASIVETYGKLPLSFEANQGQADSKVRFLSRGDGYALFLTQTEAVFSFPKSLGPEQADNPDHGRDAYEVILRMRLVGADPAPHIEGMEQLPGKANYLMGNDPGKWQTNIPTYAKVICRDVYPGVDLVYYGSQGKLEFDLVVAPGADPAAVTLSFRGPHELAVNAQGDLVLQEDGGQVRLRKPAVYQQAAGAKTPIPAEYLVKGSGQVGFRLGSYDAAKPLVIDPVLVYSTYLGGSGSDSGSAIAVDSSGNAYVAGSTRSFNFPTANPLQRTLRRLTDAFVAKFSVDGTALVYSTYLGGLANDSAHAIAVDEFGNAYVTGGTTSSDFPTLNPVQPAKSFAQDAFVVKLDASGSALVYSTFLGGMRSESGDGIGLDQFDNAYVVGGTESPDFPTANALQPTFAGGRQGGDAFVSKLNPAGNALAYSTYLGGSRSEAGKYGVAVDGSGNAYVTGRTNSTDFPTANALQPSLGGCEGQASCELDVFVSKLNAAGSALVYSTYLGGAGRENSGGIAVDGSGSVYVTGSTASGDFPLAGAIQPIGGGGASDAFLTKFNADGTALVYSTFLGGCGGDSARGVAVDLSGNAYLTGNTDSVGFPIANAMQPVLGGASDAFVTMVNAAGSAPVYSTYLGGSLDDRGGGIAVDAAGNAYLIGSTDCCVDDFPTVNAFQPASRGSSDAFVAKISNPPAALSTAPASLPVAGQRNAAAHQPGDARLAEAFGRLPLSFEPNQGQTDEAVRFLSRGRGFRLFLTAAGAVMTFRKPSTGPSRISLKSRPENVAQLVLQMQLVGAQPTAEIMGLEELPGKSHYFIGKDPGKWRTDIPAYARVHYREVYPGVTLVYYGKQGLLEYDFEVAAGADPNRILLRFEGADKLRLDAQGALVLQTAGQEIRLLKPFAYQETGASKEKVVASYLLKGPNQVGFRLGPYDVGRPLVIDPVLVYATYLGGSSGEQGFIAVDSLGNAYLAGLTESADFPTANGLQPAPGSNFDAFAAKLNAGGSALVYSTYLGGSAGDGANGISVDAQGNAYVPGGTSSSDFPTANALQPAPAGSSDAFVVKLNAAGSGLLYSTYLGGSGGDSAFGIAVGADDNAYLTGTTNSIDFPAASALQPALGGCGAVLFRCDGFVARLNSAGSALVYSTYLGGNSTDFGNAIEVDADGNAYIVGGTSSTNFPTVNALQPSFGGGDDQFLGGDAFVAKLDPTGSALVYSTYLGGSENDGGFVDVALDVSRNVFVTGRTASKDFPLVNALDPNLEDVDAFLVKLNAQGSALVYSTYLGGCGADAGFGIALDSSGNVYLAGETASTDFPIASPLQPSLASAFLPDAFAAKLNAAGSALIYSTYLGGKAFDRGLGIAVDAFGSAYVAGQTSSTDFPTLHPVQADFGGDAGAFGGDLFAAKIGVVSIIAVSPGTGPSGTRVTITGTGFLSTAGSVEVLFNGVPGIDVVVINDTTILVTVPPLPPGPVEITVTTAAGTAALPGGPGGFTAIIEAIPSLSEWGIIFLAAALFGAGIHSLVRRGGRVKWRARP